MFKIIMKLPAMPISCGIEMVSHTKGPYLMKCDFPGLSLNMLLGNVDLWRTLLRLLPWLPSFPTIMLEISGKT
jgi:hypothetical protein